MRDKRHRDLCGAVVEIISLLAIRWRIRAAAGEDWLCTLRVDTLFLEDLLPNIIKDRGLARWQISQTCLLGEVCDLAFNL